MKSPQYKKILVTGAGGFIGSHLAETLLRRGAHVRAMTLYDSCGHRGWLEDVDPKIRTEMEIVAGDIRDAQWVRQAVNGCDAVLHLAALIAIPYSYVAVDSYLDTNVRGTGNLLAAAKDFGVERFIQTSTSEVYGSAQFVPITEAHPLSAQSPYAASKIGADQLALAYHRSFALPVTVIRPFNTYGPRQSSRAVIPTIISQLLAGLPKLRLGTTSPTRDLTFVADTVAGLIAGLEGPSESVGQVIQLGSGFEISIGDLARLISAEVGHGAEIETEAARVRPAASEVERLWSDPAKAARILGWKPELVRAEGLREGVRRTIDWFREPGRMTGDQPGQYKI